LDIDRDLIQPIDPEIEVPEVALGADGAPAPVEQAA
jgi:hypothetical protein